MRNKKVPFKDVFPLILSFINKMEANLFNFKIYLKKKKVAKRGRWVVVDMDTWTSDVRSLQLLVHL